MQKILTRNAYLVGRAFLANKEAIRESISYTLSQKPTRKMAKLSSSKKVLSLCYECSNHEATLNCQQCDCSFCDTCWTKVHSSGKSLMRHVPVNIKSVVVPKSTKYCLKHSTKEVDFFCVNCNLYICANCVIFDHKTVGHEAVLIKERNCNLLNAVVRLQDDVEENIAKMEETARVS
ncbi:UNVERIFIED_CONTAM: hypothetical protein PYX00_003159 [Menopon gallinae]|uniref:B box-type domain-containing protein n=1 Tax=Menopon gallinae TaxID=328185 RepID=A0AAW2I002_9NEOP